MLLYEHIVTTFLISYYVQSEISEIVKTFKIALSYWTPFFLKKWNLSTEKLSYGNYIRIIKRKLKQLK